MENDKFARVMEIAKGHELENEIKEPMIRDSLKYLAKKGFPYLAKNALDDNIINGYLSDDFMVSSVREEIALALASKGAIKRALEIIEKVQIPLRRNSVKTQALRRVAEIHTKDFGIETALRWVKDIMDPSERAFALLGLMEGMFPDMEMVQLTH